MRRAIMIGVALGALSLHPPAGHAQPAPAGAQAEAAAAKAEGDALLAAADAADLFTNESDQGNGAILLRHKASGFRCVLNPGKAANKVTIYSQPRGDDVGCTTQTFSDTRTFYITRARGASTDIALATAVQGIISRFRGAKPVRAGRPSAPLLSPPPGLVVPESRTAVFRTATGDERVTVGKVGDWLVKYRFSAPEGVAAEGGPLDMFWTTAVLEGERHRRATGLTDAPSAAVADGAPPKPEAVAAARAQADALIAASGAPGLLENVTDKAFPEIRHTASGLVCGFDPGPRNAVVVTPARGGRGRQTTCTTGDGSTVRTTSVVDAGQANLDQEFDKAVRALRAGRKTRPYRGAKLGIQIADQGRPITMPPRRVAWLEVQDRGGWRFERLSLSLVDGWLIGHRVEAPLGEAAAADLAGELMSVTQVQSFADNRAAARAPR